MCQLCNNNQELYCNECVESLKTKIGLKCIECGTYGFVEKNEKNIRRFVFFMGEEFKDNLDIFKVCVVPMKSCPNCFKEEELIRGFTA